MLVVEVVVTESPSSISLGWSRCLWSNRDLFQILASFTLVVAHSTSSGLRSSCRIRATSNSSLRMSLVQLIIVHEAIVRSTSMMVFCPNIRFAGMYPVTELWVVLFAQNAYGNNLSQSLTRPSHVRTMAFTIGWWPRSIFPFASGLYAVVRDSFTPNRPNSCSASSLSSSPRSTTIFPTHPYRHMTSSIRNLHTAAMVLFVSALPSVTRSFG